MTLHIFLCTLFKDQMPLRDSIFSLDLQKPPTISVFSGEIWQTNSKRPYLLSWLIFSLVSPLFLSQIFTISIFPASNCFQRVQDASLEHNVYIGNREITKNLETIDIRFIGFIQLFLDRRLRLLEDEEDEYRFHYFLQKI